MHTLTSPSQDANLQTIVSLLVKAEPDAITHLFLLGTTRMKRRTETIFMTGAPSCHCTAHYFFLVLVTTEREGHEIHDKLETHSKALIPVTTIVLKTEEFSNWLGNAHPFAYKVATAAPLVYSGGHTPLPMPGKPDSQLQQKKSRDVYRTGTERADAFYAGAELYKLREEYSMAAFMLQQAAEQALKTALQVLTGYNCNTHNLDKLVRYGNLISWGLPEIFERHQAKNEAAFQLLQKAYIEARYRDQYTVSLNDLLLLLDKVQRLLQHLKEVYINSLAEER